MEMSLIIVAFNAVEYLKLLIASICKHSAFKHEIIVYDDGSSDATLPYIKGLKNVTWISSEENDGICTATNRAALFANKDYLYFLNTDHYVSPGWDVALANRLDEKTVVSSLCIEPGLVPVSRHFVRYDCGRSFRDFDEKCFLTKVHEISREEAITGVNYPFALSKVLWKKTGGLDDTFNPGPSSDPDLFYRLYFEGAVFVRALDSVLYHFSGKSTRFPGDARNETSYWKIMTSLNEGKFAAKWGERCRYSVGGAPDPGPEAKSRYHQYKELEHEHRI